MPESPGNLSQADDLDRRVVVLTHYLPPYMARVLFHAAKDVADFRVLLSTRQEPNRQFGDTWEGLNVAVQKSWMFRRPWKHTTGFTDELFVHVPYDTFGQLRRAKPDIVLSYELGFRSLASALYCKFFRCPLLLCVCVSEHTEQGRGWLRHRLRQWLLKTAQGVTYNGPSCFKVVRDYGVQEDRLYHFPYAASDLFQFSGQVERAPDSNYRLMCIGQLSERKGVMPLLEGLISYCHARPEQEVAIDFIGTGSQQERMQELAKPSNLKVRFLGHLDYDQMVEAMRQAGILVFPTLADEWGMVVNEAMATGMPVLGSCFAQACTTLIEENVNGWCFDPTSESQLHKKLDTIFACDPEDLLQMRHVARETVAPITSQASARLLLDALRAVDRA